MRIKHLPPVIAFAVLAACGVSSATGDGNPPPNPKWFVCKYVTDPKGEERLQSGQNPISVSENAFPAGVTPAVGVEFNDAQGRSVIIAADTGQNEPDAGDCPPPNNPTTTTGATTSTTSTSTSTTSTSSPPTSTTTTSSTSPTTTTVTSPSTTTTVAPSTSVPGLVLDVDFLTPICDGDVPYLTYSASFGTATTVTRITFVNPDGPDVSYFNLPLSGRVLWPGAVVGPNGEPLDWPGWTQQADGTWVEGDEFDWVRPTVTVELEINPVASETIGYPPSTPQCATNPPQPGAPPAPPGAPPVPAPPVTTTVPDLPITR